MIRQDQAGRGYFENNDGSVSVYENDDGVYLAANNGCEYGHCNMTWEELAEVVDLLAAMVRARSLNV